MKKEAGFKQTEVGLIPSDWEVITFGDAFYFLNTATYSRAELSENSDIKYIHYGDIHVRWNHFLDFGKNSLPTISNEKVKNYSLIQDGDLIMADASEDYSGVGKCVEVQDIGNEKAISGLHTFLMRDKGAIFVNGFRGYIHSNSLVKKQFDMLATGMKVYGVSKSNLKTIFIPRPPLKEQTLIATAISDADSLITSLEKLLAKKRMIKQGAMQKLLAPKKGWDLKKIGEIGKPYGGLSGKAKGDFEKGEFPYIPFMNIMSNPVIDTSYFDYVNIGSNESQNQTLQGDLFFNGSSETPEEVGMCSVLLDEIPNLYLNSFCFGFRLNKELKNDGLYLSYYFRSSEGRKLFYSLAQGATRYNLSKSNFMRMEISLPKIEEQLHIATILKDMDSELTVLEKKLEKARVIKAGMMQQLLTGKIRLI